MIGPLANGYLRPVFRVWGIQGLGFEGTRAPGNLASGFFRGLRTYLNASVMETYVERTWNLHRNGVYVVDRRFYEDCTE